MKSDPIMLHDAVRHATEALASRINEFAAYVRKDLRAAAMMLDRAIEKAMSPDAQLSDVTDAAISVRAVAIASDRELQVKDFEMLKRLGGRISELDDGDMVAAVTALVACRVRL